VARDQICTYVPLEHIPGSQGIYKGMPPLTSYFVMRKEPWEKMIRGLISADGTQEIQKIMVISGMGGCGKTQPVIHFMTEFRSRCVGKASSAAYLITSQIQVCRLHRW
jgi:hypothetical protein